jgi:hypothetical protein
MKKMVNISITLFVLLNSCIFAPETPEYPGTDTEYVDRLSLGDIMSGTGYSFQYGGYDELFSGINGDIFTDIVGLTKDKSLFVGRLNTIVGQYGDSVSVEWSSSSSGDFLSETDGFEKSLSIRDYRVSLPGAVVYTGRVEVTVRYSTNYKWQIIHWKEIENNEGRYSFFHPDFSN